MQKISYFHRNVVIKYIKVIPMEKRKFSAFCRIIYIVIFFYEYKFTIENKKTKKDIHEPFRHLRIPGTNLKTINFNNI